MPIILSGNISPQATRAPAPQPQRVSIPVNRPSAAPTASGESALLVNGQKKSIGKKSQYLLDMLTLDDE